MTAAPAVHNDPIEDWSDMEGVEREGLHASQHAPAAGAPDRPWKGKGGKGKAVQTATPPAIGQAGRQRKRQAAVDAAKAEKAMEPTPPVRPILRRPETEEAETKREREREEEVARKKKEEKTEAKKRWEGGELTGVEVATYDAAASPIEFLARDSEDLAEVAAGQSIAHMAGMRALEEEWEESWPRGQGPPPERRMQQRASPQAPQHGLQRGQVPSRLQQQTRNWAQRAAAAAALPQTKEAYSRVGRKGKPEKKATGLEPTRGSIPWDERTIAFERAARAPQINPAVAKDAAAFVNIALSKVAPAHVRTEAFKISPRGRLSTSV